MSILMILVITLIIAGCVVFVVFQFMNYDTDPVENFLFEVKASGSSDEVEIMLVQGSLNTTRIVLRLDGSPLNHTSEMISAGEGFSIPAGIDIVTGSTYRIIITVDDSVMYDNSVTAKP